MLNYQIKEDDTRTNSSLVFANELNSSFQEQLNVISPFYTPNPNNNKQLINAIDVLAGTRFYEDVGVVDNVVLKRETLPTPRDHNRMGVVGLFSPKLTNTTNVTISFLGEESVPLLLNNVNLKPGELKAGVTYIFICKDGFFELIVLEHTKVTPSIESKLYVSPRLVITDDSITLPTEVSGDVIHNTAYCFLDEDSYEVLEVTCSIDSIDKTKINFDTEDGLNGFFATVTYIPQ